MSAIREEAKRLAQEKLLEEQQQKEQQQKEQALSKEPVTESTSIVPPGVTTHIVMCCIAV